MPQEGFEGKSYKEQPEGISERGRAFLEALARRKRARGEEPPPLYQRLLQGAAFGEVRVPEPGKLDIYTFFSSLLTPLLG